jgi:hypothetical protein
MLKHDRPADPLELLEFRHQKAASEFAEGFVVLARS